MKWFRPLALAVILVSLAVIAWQVWPRSTAGGTSAPAFAATASGQSKQVSFPGDYSGKWVWLMFSGNG